MGLQDRAIAAAEAAKAQEVQRRERLLVVARSDLDRALGVWLDQVSIRDRPSVKIIREEYVSSSTIVDSEFPEHWRIVFEFAIDGVALQAVFHNGRVAARLRDRRSNYIYSIEDLGNALKQKKILPWQIDNRPRI